MKVYFILFLQICLQNFNCTLKNNLRKLDGDSFWTINIFTIKKMGPYFSSSVPILITTIILFLLMILLTTIFIINGFESFEKYAYILYHYVTNKTLKDNNKLSDYPTNRVSAENTNNRNIDYLQQINEPKNNKNSIVIPISPRKKRNDINSDFKKGNTEQNEMISSRPFNETSLLKIKNPPNPNKKKKRGKTTQKTKHPSSVIYVCNNYNSNKIIPSAKSPDTETRIDNLIKKVLTKNKKAEKRNDNRNFNKMLRKLGRKLGRKGGRIK